jgi:UDP-N-acetyl-D-mannosaminouronate:lipid I N-acetyl-D-mannosaminouronosyltransferase
MNNQYAYICKKKAYGFKSTNELLDYIIDKQTILIALNAEKLNNENTELTNIINENIGYPDGIGAVLALKRKGVYSKKIAGADLWLDIIQRHHQTKSFYFIGGVPSIIEKTIMLLRKEFPMINIVGFRDGFLKEGDSTLLIKDFIDKKPDIIFVAMGSPKQEFLMHKFIQEYKALYMGLGGSFDVYTGYKKRAPLLYQKLGIEWMYRFLKEPSRWKRQWALFSFAVKIILNKI